MAPISTTQLELPLERLENPSTPVPAPRVPSIEYVLAITGHNTEARAKTLHNARLGIEQISSIKAFYQHLNCTEAIHLVAAAYEAMKHPRFTEYAKSHTVKAILDQLCEPNSELPIVLWANEKIDSTDIPPRFEAEHKVLNPYLRNERNSMFKRLSEAAPKQLAAFKDQVSHPAIPADFPPGNSRSKRIMWDQVYSPIPSDLGEVNRRDANRIRTIISRF